MIRIRAVNTAADRENKIHDDRVAAECSARAHSGIGAGDVARTTHIYRATDELGNRCADRRAQTGARNFERIVVATKGQYPSLQHP